MEETAMWLGKEGDDRPRLFNVLSAYAKKENLTRNGVLDVRKFADDVGKSHECVYRWLRGDYFPIKNIDKILSASNGQLSEETLMRYVKK